MKEMKQTGITTRTPQSDSSDVRQWSYIRRAYLRNTSQVTLYNQDHKQQYSRSSLHEWMPCIQTCILNTVQLILHSTTSRHSAKLPRAGKVVACCMLCHAALDAHCHFDMITYLVNAFAIVWTFNLSHLTTSNAALQIAWDTTTDTYVAPICSKQCSTF